MKKNNYNRITLFKLILTNKKYLTLFLIGGLFFFLAGLAYIFMPLIIRTIFDYVLPTRQLGLLMILIYISIALLVYQVFSIFIKDIIMLSLRTQIIQDNTDKYLLNYFFINDKKFIIDKNINLNSDLPNFINTYKSTLATVINFIFFSLMLAILIIILIIFYNLKLGLLTFVFIMLHIINIFVWGKYNKKESDAFYHEHSNYMGSLTDFFAGFIDVRFNKVIKYFKEDIFNRNKNLHRVEYRKFVIISFQDIIQKLLTALHFTLILIIGSNYIITNDITVGILLASIFLLQHIFHPIYLMGDFFNNLHSANAITERIGIVSSLNYDKKLKINYDEYKKNEINKIIIKKINFGFDNRLILKDFSYTFEAGNFYAIMAKSGFGKSTLLKIISGFINDYKGDICLNDINIKDIPVYALREYISYVHQSPWIYKGTIKENIILKNEYNKEKLEKVSEAASILKWIKSQNDNFNYPLKEGGGNISGGQSQRLCIARALYRDTPVILFDEITASLDVKNEREILLSLKEIAKSKIVICITHRRENLNIFDKVLYLDKMRGKKI